MLVPAQAANVFVASSQKRLSQEAHPSGASGAGTMKDCNRSDKACRVCFLLATNEQHLACPDPGPRLRQIHGHRHEESSRIAEVIEPYGKGLGSTSIDEDRVE